MKKPWEIDPEDEDYDEDEIEEAWTKTSANDFYFAFKKDPYIGTILAVCPKDVWNNEGVIYDQHFQYEHDQWPTYLFQHVEAMFKIDLPEGSRKSKCKSDLEALGFEYNKAME